jgi:hypothetical protein
MARTINDPRGGMSPLWAAIFLGLIVFWTVVGLVVWTVT